MGEGASYESRAGHALRIELGFRLVEVTPKKLQLPRHPVRLRPVQLLSKMGCRAPYSLASTA